MAVNVFDIAGTWRRGLSDPGALVGTLSVDTDTGRMSGFSLLRTGGIKENTGTTISSPSGPRLMGGTPLPDATYGLDAVTYQGVRNGQYRMETMLRGGYSMLATWQLPTGSLASYTGGAVTFSFASGTAYAASSPGSGTLKPARVASAAPTDIVLSPATIAENSPVGSRVGVLTTSDPTVGDTFTYSLVPGSGATDNALFQVVGNEVRANAAFNFEAKSGYTVRVRTTDRGGLSFEKALPITVTNVNEAPTDISLTGSSVAENMPAGTVLGTLSTMDPDSANSFTYTLVTGTGATDNASFRIVGNSLQTAASFNYEAKNSYSVRIRSTDQGGLLTEKPFTIVVTDVYEGPTTTKGFNLFDNRSLFNERIYNAVLKTDDLGGGKTVKYWTTRYSYSRATVGYSIKVPSPIVEATLIARLDTPFPGFSGATGALRVQGTVVDSCAAVYNGKTTAGYTPIDITQLVKGRTSVDIEAYLVSQVGGGRFLSSSSWETSPALQLLVAFQNSAPSDIVPTQTTVAENLPSGATVGTLKTIDPDAGDTFSYSLVSGTGSADNACFQIIGNTLQTAASFNYEGKNSYTVRIRSTDQGGLFTEKPFTITVSDVNEAPTGLILTNTTASLPENTATSSRIKVADIVVADDALGTNTLSLSGADAANFEIDGTALYLKARTNLDYEGKASYAVIVGVQDSTVAGSTAKTAGLALAITNVNEAPTDISLAGTGVAENLPAGTVVGTLTTTDPDSADSCFNIVLLSGTDSTANTFTYSLVSGTGSTDNASFKVVGDALHTAASFDFEAKNSYTVRVRSTDQDGLFTEKVFMIAITDVNEDPTDISLAGTNIAENMPSGTAVGMLATTDPDSASTFTYALESGTGSTDNSSFQIVGNTLQTATSFNYEGKNSYTLRIRSTDQGGLFTEKPFTITVGDVNEAPTGLILTNTTASLPENTATSSRIKVADIVVADDALGANTLSLSGADAASFEIDGTVLYLKAGTNLDYDAKPSYAVTVWVSDPTLVGSATLSANAALSLTKGNSAPFDISLSPDAVAENAPPATLVGELMAADLDAGDTFTYTLVPGEGSTHNELFIIEGSALLTATTFDYETQSSFVIRVRATDADGLFAEKTFTIAVTNVDEPPTDILLMDAVFELSEATDTTSRIKLADILVFDDALGDNTLTISGRDASLFEIDGNALFLKAGATLDYETQYIYGISIGLSTNDFVSTPYTLFITNAADRPIAITLSWSRVIEGMPAGAVVGMLNTTDPDSNNTFTYTLVPGKGDADNASFRIVGFELQTAESFDYESKRHYTVRIRSTDSNELFTEQDFEVSVTNVNEYPTDISLAGTSVAEHLPFGTVVGTLSTTDPDSDAAFTYALVAGEGSADNDSFLIVGNELRTAAEFDYGSKASYSIRVRSTDAGWLFTEKTFTISVTGVDEAPGSLTLYNKTQSLPKLIDTSSRIQVADIGFIGDALGTNTLFLTGADADIFEIEEAALFLKAGTIFNDEAKSSYAVTVCMQDLAVEGSTAQTAEFTLQIIYANQAPTGLVLVNTTTSLAENTDTSNRTKIADIAVIDDAQGRNALSLTGADAADFEIDGTALYLKAGTKLDYEAKTSYAVTVCVKDSTVEGSVGLTADFTLTISDVNEVPSGLALTNTTTSLPENTATSSRIKVADIVVTDDALGTNTLSRSGLRPSLRRTTWTVPQTSHEHWYKNWGGVNDRRQCRHDVESHPRKAPDPGP